MNKVNNERAGLPSASNWRRYEKCPGSFQLEQQAVKLGQDAFRYSAAAARGERIHAYLAGIADEDGNEIKLDASEQESANLLAERAQEQAQRIFGEERTQQLAEKRLWFKRKGRSVLSGQFDRVVYTSEVALCQDFKTGWSEPDPAEQNAQLKVLAVLVGLHMPETLREVIVQVISGPFGVSEYRLSIEGLAKAYGDIVTTLQKINAPNALLKPSPEACQYCPAINICQAVRDLAKPITKVQLSELPADGARAAKLLDEVALMRKLCDGIEEFYASKLTADPSYQLPGYAMVPGATRREVTSWEAAHLRLSEYLDGTELWGAANYRLGDIEKALGKKLKLKGPELKTKLGEILYGLITEKQNAASLKRVKGEPKLASLELP